jgi:hypothetical protein
MKINSLIGAAILESLLLAAVVRAAPPQSDTGPLPTRAELKQMHDAGEYRVCLHQIGRILRLGPAKSYDKAEMLLLRGDCLLHLEDPSTAKLAYQAAMNSTVPAQAREARAMTLLISRSTKLAYLPRSGDGGEAINIASHATRTRAMSALLHDELRESKPVIDRALAADNLAPIMDALPKFYDLYALERTATDGDGETRPILRAVGERARTLVSRELVVMDQKVAGIEKRADEIISAPYGGGSAWWWSGSTRRGLYTDDRGQLRDLIDYLAKIADTTKLGQQVAISFDGDPHLWEPLIVHSIETLQHAQNVLDAE